MLYIHIISDDQTIDAVYAVTIEAGNCNGIDLASELTRKADNVIDIPGTSFFYCHL